MIGINIKADLRELQKMATKAQRDAIPKVVSRAINRALTSVQAEANKQIRTERALSAKTVRDALRIEKATRGKLYGSVIASGRPIPLREYRARQGKKGTTVIVTPGPRKLVVHAGNKAFIVQKIAGHVFARVGAKRYPIKKLYGPSIPTAFIKDKVVQAMTKVAGDTWQKRIAAELQYELSKL